MPKRYLLNACIEFYPVEHQLVAYGSQNLSIVLNAPVSRCLQLLIERRYTLVPQQEFYPYVWGEMGSSIPVSTLYQNIALLRKALKAFAQRGEKMITTVPKQGFALAPDVDVQEISEATEDVELVLPQSANTDIIIQQKDVSQEASLSASTPMVKEQPLVKRRWIWLLCVSNLILFGLAALQFLKWGYQSAENYSAQYQYQWTISNCRVYTNNDSRGRAEAEKLIASSNIDCVKKTHLYISDFQYSMNTSILSCDRALEDNTTPNCQVYNLLRGA